MKNKYIDYSGPGGQIIPHDPQEEAERQTNLFKGFQEKVDTDEEYRLSIIKAREESIKRVHETGLISAYDQFLSRTWFSTLPKQSRENFLKKVDNINIVDFLTQGLNEE